MDEPPPESPYIPEILFLGGIHGVGKTTFASKLANELGLRFESAGQLIKEHRRSIQGSEKRVMDIKHNQDLLINALSELSHAQPILLDGHFCLLGEGDLISAIPLKTFQDLRLISILVIKDSPNLIQRRLKKRDGQEFSEELLSRFQEAEVLHAQFVAETLKIPFGIFHPGQVDKANLFIMKTNKKSV